MNGKVILLKKLLQPEDKSTTTWAPSQNFTHWEILGHFDELYIYSLDDSENFVNQIRKDKDHIAEQNSGSTYYHPLYLLCDTESDAPPDSWYCAIVRIHFSDSTKLIQQFKTLSKGVSESLKEMGFFVNIFYGAEFSDMVLEVYSNNMSLLVSSVLHLREEQEIGTMYTHFGISYPKLVSKEQPPAEQKNLEFLSLRFPIADEAMVNSQTELLLETLGKKPVYCVTGVDDILLRYQDLPAKKLVELFRKIFLEEGTLARKHLNSTTRLGISIEFPIQGGSGEDTLQNCSRKLADLRSRIEAHKSKAISSWWRHASELSKTLERMSTMPVMDEVIYLLAPAFQTFFENILVALDGQDTPLLSNDHDYHRQFVELCFYLMEQLMRLEGQLSQHPELRPAIYDIPVFLLEYTLAFLNQVCETLQKVDQPPYVVFDFLLVPHSCARIESLELFPAVPGGKHGLVQIEIPTDWMYRPREALQILCHEASHYVGQTSRLRYERKNYYCTAAASIFATLVFNMKEQGFIRLSRKRFLASIRDIPQPTVRQMEMKVLECASKLLQDGSFEDFLFEYLTQADHPQFVGKLSAPSKDYFQMLFARRLQDINTLFHEVYADICMVHLLRISTDDYIGRLLEVLKNDPADERTTSNELFAVRIYTCLTAIGHPIHYSRNEYLDQWNIIQKIITNIKQEIADGTDGVTGNTYPITAIYALLCYASACGKSIQEKLSDMDTQRVYDMYFNLTDKSTSFSYILSEISNCRDKIVKRTLLEK